MYSVAPLCVSQDLGPLRLESKRVALQKLPDGVGLSPVELALLRSVAHQRGVASIEAHAERGSVTAAPLQRGLLRPAPEVFNAAALLQRQRGKIETLIEAWLPPAAPPVAAPSAAAAAAP